MKSTTAATFLDNKVPPPVVALATGLLMWGLSYVGPVIQLTFSTRLYAAMIIMLCGVACAVTGVMTFKIARTTINPHRPQDASTIITSGIYRWSRNPMYVGLVLVLTGWGVYLAAPATLAGPVLFVLYITRFQIIPEERILESRFGEEFTRYRQQVRRWI